MQQNLTLNTIKFIGDKESSLIPPVTCYDYNYKINPMS